MQILKPFLLLSFLMISLSGTSLFATAIQLPDPACLPDLKHYCPNLQGAGLWQCIQMNQKKFSPVCSTKMAEGRKKYLALREACKADANKFCSQARRVPGEMMKCLTSHKSQLSSACQANLPSAK